MPAPPSSTGDLTPRCRCSSTSGALVRPCRMVSPVVERGARARAGELKVVKLNIDAAPNRRRYGVQGIPLLVLLRDGEEVDRLAGAAPRPHIERWLEQQLAAEAPTR